MLLLAVSGSLRTASSNSVLLRACAQLAPAGVHVQLYEGLSELPHFNPEVEPSPEVVELKRIVKNADGILFCTPEYVHGLPGSFKNWLDWLVSDGELWNKPVAVFSARRTEFAEPQLREILHTLMASVCEEASVLVAFPTNKISVEEVLSKPELAESLGEAMRAFVACVEAQQSA